MSREGGLVAVIGMNFAAAVLMGVAVATDRPIYYLPLAAMAGTTINLVYVMAGRLWQRP